MAAQRGGRGMGVVEGDVLDESRDGLASVATGVGRQVRLGHPVRPGAGRDIASAPRMKVVVSTVTRRRTPGRRAARMSAGAGDPAG